MVFTLLGDSTMNNVLLPVVAADDLVFDVGVDVMAGFHTPTPSFSGQIDNALTLIRKGEKEKLDTTGACTRGKLQFATAIPNPATPLYSTKKAFSPTSEMSSSAHSLCRSFQ